MSRKRVLCVGNTVIDYTFKVAALPGEAGKYFAESFMRASGGPAATASVAVARLGGAARLWTRIGDDPPGDQIVRELAACGVEIPESARFAGRISSQAGVMVDAGGERIIVNYLDPHLPAGADFLPLDEVRRFDCVLGDIRWPLGTKAVLEAAGKAGVTSVLDADNSLDPQTLHMLAPLADHVVFSRNGLRQYTGEDAPEAGLARAAAAVCSSPYVTLGEQGCKWLDGNAVRHCPAFPVAAVNTTGAGDVFHGAFALALAEGMPVPDGIRFAAAAAAVKCTRSGGWAGVPDRKELEVFLSERSQP